MKEQDFLKIIQELAGTEYIGDDCAYLKDLGIVITQDSLTENVHFKREWYSPYQLGYKSITVNISDILASGAKPAYVTIALSLPSDIDSNFIKEFYKGANDGLCGAKIVGGDITGSKSEIMISVAAIGKTEGRNISSRKNAKIGYSIVVKGKHGLSSAGLKELIDGGKREDLIKAHITPNLEKKFSEFISLNCNDKYAMMDTSDGLADALFKIAESSNVKIIVDFDKIPTNEGISYENILFGGEDYKLIAAVPEEIALKSDGIIIGNVLEYDGTRLDISGKKYNNYNDLTVYNHF
ncbi:thiamine-phosphate kinase [bacterium]|nr:thiamine-phosphate kinase [bacterium]